MRFQRRLTDSGQPYRDMSEDEKNGTDDKRPVDVCLASSIIEVGVDVPRLEPDDSGWSAENHCTVYPGDKSYWSEAG